MHLRITRLYPDVTRARAVGIAALSAAALLACAQEREPDPAILVEEVTYEAGDHAQISEQTAAPDALSITNEIVRQGQAAGMAVLREDDEQFRGDLGYRSEWQNGYIATMGNEYWYGWSVYLPEDWDLGENHDFFDDRIIFQFHEGTGSSPALSLHVDDGEDRFFVRRRASEDSFDYLGSLPFETERWYDFAFHVRWSRGDDGFLDVFVDGELAGEYEGPTLVDGRSVYAKWGIYGQPTRIILDEIRIAEGRDGGLDLVSP